MSFLFGSDPSNGRFCCVILPVAETVTREGRYVHASPEELNRWLGRESAGEPVQIASESADLSADLRRGLSYVRKHHKIHKLK